MPVSTDKDSLSGLDGGVNSEAIPIREVSKITGVNSVTLRAWERRYGLIKPLRTAKGHRLYRPEDVQRIQEIQAWLARGLAISKIKALLESPEARHPVPNTGGLWQEFAEPMHRALETLNRRGMDQLLAQLISLYPVELVVDQLLEPLLIELRGEQYYGAATKLTLLETALWEYFCSALFRQRQKARGPRVLVTQLPETRPDLFAMIFSYTLTVNDYRVDYLSAVPEAELIFALQQMRAKTLIIYADSASGHLNLVTDRGQWEKNLQVPVFLAGKLSCLPKPEQGEAHNRSLGTSHQQMLAKFIELEQPTRAVPSKGDEPL